MAQGKWIVTVIPKCPQWIHAEQIESLTFHKDLLFLEIFFIRLQFVSLRTNHPVDFYVLTPIQIAQTTYKIHASAAATINESDVQVILSNIRVLLFYSQNLTNELSSLLVKKNSDVPSVSQQGSNMDLPNLSPSAPTVTVKSSSDVEVTNEAAVKEEQKYQTISILISLHLSRTSSKTTRRRVIYK